MNGLKMRWSKSVNGPHLFYIRAVVGAVRINNMRAANSKLQLSALRADLLTLKLTHLPLLSDNFSSHGSR